MWGAASVSRLASEGRAGSETGALQWVYQKCGKLRTIMASGLDTSRDKVRLLSSTNLEEVVSIVAEIILGLGAPKSVAILVFDPDLEEFSDRFHFGEKKTSFGKLVEQFNLEEDELEEGVIELDADDFDVPSELEPVHIYHLKDGDSLCATIIMSGDLHYEADDFEQMLDDFPFAASVKRAWELRELTKENERLRRRYEELEDRIISMEEQTRQLIHDVMLKDSLRTKHTDRERLLYRISNAVRSSLDIEKVLKDAVENIGATYQVSRTLIMGFIKEGERLDVFEYHRPDVPPAKALLETVEGSEFIHGALVKKVPQYLSDDGMANDSESHNQLLRQMDFRSALLVPLVMRDQVLAVLCLQDCVIPREWDIDDVSLLSSLADQLSVGIENAQLHAERERQAVTDGLTGINNRRKFMDEYEREFVRAKRYGEPFSLIVVDLDFLKKINDNHGHQAGDEAIKAVATVMKQSCRTIDIPARYGGEEFCLLLPNTDIELAGQIAERLRKLINECLIVGFGNISASIGVACYPKHAPDPDTLFQKADEALYKAKESGRNRVCISE